MNNNIEVVRIVISSMYFNLQCTVVCLNDIILFLQDQIRYESCNTDV